MNIIFFLLSACIFSDFFFVYFFIFGAKLYTAFLMQVWETEMVLVLTSKTIKHGPLTRIWAEVENSSTSSSLHAIL